MPRPSVDIRCRSRRTAGIRSAEGSCTGPRACSYSMNSTNTDETSLTMTSEAIMADAISSSSKKNTFGSVWAISLYSLTHCRPVMPWSLINRAVWSSASSAIRSRTHGTALISSLKVGAKRTIFLSGEIPYLRQKARFRRRFRAPRGRRT